ncbi:hypothetical protein AB1Y20_023269 [Prymnesium parvum]|uniref:Uncharacterized protein n=1 Tax=Prymnesium parvum TaxID=97485 RepID=A0AB34JE17_PRYPA
MALLLLPCVSWKPSSPSQSAFPPSSVARQPPPALAGRLSRRAALHQALLPAAACFVACPLPSRAFDNRLPPDELELKYKTPRTPGPKPTDIGPDAAGGLKPCIDGKPHCFSSSPETFEDNDLYNADYGTTADWLVEPFRYEMALPAAVDDVKAAIAAYPPGQNGVDGGGFKVIEERVAADSAYIYVQFEARRRGYIDDMEFSLKDGIANVRTSSRLGYLDMGVNAKRFNWFAARLGGIKGWRTKPILSKGHEEYFALNGVTDAEVVLARPKS